MQTGNELRYLETLERLYDLSERNDVRGDRTGTGTYSLFGVTTKYDISGDVIPLLTTKRVAYKSVMAELVWFLMGSTNVNLLRAMGSTIWDEWANEEGELGPVYGKQWRAYNGATGVVDQIHELTQGLVKDPYGRRHILNAWVPDLVPVANEDHGVNIENGKQVLPPCHLLAQFYVNDEGSLDCLMYQRSGDWFLGVPFNIASYSALTHIIARAIGREANTLTHVVGDAHLYSNHLAAARLQLDRKDFMADSPTFKVEHSNLLDLVLREFSTLSLWDMETIKDKIHSLYSVNNYNHLGPIRAEVAV